MFVTTGILVTIINIITFFLNPAVRKKGYKIGFYIQYKKWYYFIRINPYIKTEWVLRSDVEELFIPLLNSKKYSMNVKTGDIEIHDDLYILSWSRVFKKTISNHHVQKKIQKVIDEILSSTLEGNEENIREMTIEIIEDIAKDYFCIISIIDVVLKSMIIEYLNLPWWMMIVSVYTIHLNAEIF
jgi:hypothetical protein